MSTTKKFEVRARDGLVKKQGLLWLDDSGVKYERKGEFVVVIPYTNVKKLKYATTQTFILSGILTLGISIYFLRKIVIITDERETYTFFMRKPSDVRKAISTIKGRAR